MIVPLNVLNNNVYITMTTWEVILTWIVYTINTCGVGASNTIDGSNDVMHDVTDPVENSAHVSFNETYCAAEQPEVERNKNTESEWEISI